MFESENPSAGGDDDVIQLNVGGHRDIAVLRRTLTQFEDSMLAVKFSGRWDDSIEKDRDGNIFIDQDPKDFITLIGYLRLRMNNHSRQVAYKHLPNPTYSFCSMLEYYNLMPGVYPQNWIGDRDAFTSEEISYGTVVLVSKNEEGLPAYASVVQYAGKLSRAGVSEFTVEYEKGTTGSVGWLQCADKGLDTTVFHPLTESVGNSIFLNVTERKIFGPMSILEDNMMMNCNGSRTKVICKYDGQMRYSIEVDGVSVRGGVATTLNKPSRFELCIFPVISFRGKVTVTGLKYAIDKLHE